jgi:hypothetical protein
VAKSSSDSASELPAPEAPLQRFDVPGDARQPTARLAGERASVVVRSPAGMVPAGAPSVDRALDDELLDSLWGDILDEPSLSKRSL